LNIEEEVLERKENEEDKNENEGEVEKNKENGVNT
jgi:hypothetical protein